MSVRISESFVPQLAMEFLHGGVKTTRFSNTFREMGYETLYEKTADGEYVDSGKKNPLGVLQLDYASGLNITIDPNITSTLQGIDSSKTYYRKVGKEYVKATIKQRLHLVVMPSLARIKHENTVVFEPEYNRFDGATGMVLYRDKGRRNGTYDMLGPYGFNNVDPNDFRDYYAIVLCSDARLLDSRSYVKNDDGSYSYAPEDYDIDDTYPENGIYPRAEAFDAWFYVGSRRTKFLVLMPSELARIRIDVSKEFAYDEEIYDQEERYVFKPITRYIVENHDDFDTLDDNSLFRIHLNHFWDKTEKKLVESRYQISFGRRVNIYETVNGDYNYPPFVSKSYLERRKEYYTELDAEYVDLRMFDYYDIYEDADATLPLNERWTSDFRFDSYVDSRWY